jgi:hypothetical protein
MERSLPHKRFKQADETLRYMTGGNSNIYLEFKTLDGEPIAFSGLTADTPSTSSSEPFIR